MRSIVVFTFLCFFSTAFGQAMFWNNYSIYNPAASGVFYKHHANVSAIGRFNRTYPSTFYFANYDARIKKLHGGLGINYVHSGFGSSHRNDMTKVNYSYHLQLGEHSLLSAGAYLGYTHSRTEMRTYINNELILAESTSDGALTTGFGLHFQHRNLHVGVSVLDLNQPHFKTAGGIESRQPRSYIVYADYLWNISDNFALRPAAILNFADQYGIASQWSLRAIIHQKFWAGVSLNERLVGISAGYDFNERFSLGYSFEIYPSGAKPLANGMHGLTLGIKLK